MSTKLNSKEPSKMGSAEESLQGLENTEDLNEDPKFIEKILREVESDPCLTVNSVDCVLGSSLGDNYMSLVKRAFVRGSALRQKIGNKIIELLLFSKLLNLRKM